MRALRILAHFIFIFIFLGYPRAFTDAVQPGLLQMPVLAVSEDVPLSLNGFVKDASLGAPDR